MNMPSESGYQMTFRENESTELGEHLKSHNSVAVIGMKRVGISNFLRFFLYHPKIEETYIHNGMKHIFIPVDLHDLVARDIYPFWTLTLKRLVDKVEDLNLDQATTDTVRRYFTESIQLHDLFFTVDSIRKTLLLISSKSLYPTLFFIRFDRIRDAVSAEFFENLQGIKDAVHGHVSYVFTTYRPLPELAPKVFSQPSLSVFCQNMQIRPAGNPDMQIILETFLKRYEMRIPDKIKAALVNWSAGHVQYLHLSLIRLKEEKVIPDNLDEVYKLLITDEEITSQSEELFDSLNKNEQSAVTSVANFGKIRDEDKADLKYLTDTGIILKTEGKFKLFNIFLADYIKQRQLTKPGEIDFTNKENKLFMILKSNQDNIVERDDIVNAVWPESSEMGVSDWAIDRLIARVRIKLREQKSGYRIVTVITRGFKLVSE
jgi:hypothetical protein